MKVINLMSKIITKIRLKNMKAHKDKQIILIEDFKEERTQEYKTPDK